ncbi:phytol kinase [Striga asiatica]|uniref:phytol kinase n=1 Tax=Striga asiatica TaxID=4170 RepID=A0A5A7R0M5_STRAF|nr:phytol kinase [Striga asiatica]
MVLGVAMRLSLRAPPSVLHPPCFVSFRSPIPSSGPRLFPATLPPHILTKPSGRRLNISTAAGFGVAVLNDAGATTLALGGAYALVSTFDNLTRRGIIAQTFSRKLVHILSGLLFLASWPIFRYILFLLKDLDSTFYPLVHNFICSKRARYFASIVPFINCLRLLVNGLSLTTDEGLIKSVSREGKPEELLKGPLYYVLVLILCAVAFWRESPIGMITLSMIPLNSLTLRMLYYYAVLGYIQLEWIKTAKRVALVSLVATVVESLPITGIIDDNLSVPLVSIVTSFLVFGSSWSHV